MADDDPVIASYKVYLNPSLPLGRRLLVLQHPNITDGASSVPPSELRLKAQSGMVEVDVPVDHSAAYDREKGQSWGRALKSSMAAKNGGSHGLAGGFGFGAVQHRGGGGGGPGRAARKAAELEDEGILGWEDAVRQGKVLETRTLGGQKAHADEVQYMVGVFQGNLHLTPVSSLIHLRPQLHHIDAAAEHERQSATKDTSSTVTATSTTTSARAIHMTIKATTDGDLVAPETMADRLRSVQSEAWRRLHHTDEHEEAAWDVYHESMFLKGPRADNGGARTSEEVEELEGKVPRFQSKWEEQQLLEAVSGLRKPKPRHPDRDEPVTDVKKAEKQIKKQDAEDKRLKGRARGGGNAGAPRRGGRPRTAATSKVIPVD